MSLPRLIAYYLPQFHPIPENDQWWGKGFTEWTNVGKAKALFPGHMQPKVPSELGYYDLRVPETRKAQAKLAQEYGIEGFCYWHYWFGNGKRLLERPFNEVVMSGEPEFPFCLAWANESWQGFWHGAEDRPTLIEQLYPGDIDIENHFYSLLPAFKDNRYIKVDGKLLFLIYRPLDMPDHNSFFSIWQKLARENGLSGFFFVGMTYFERDIDLLLKIGFDAVNYNGMNRYRQQRKSLKYALLGRFYKYAFGCQHVCFYKYAMKFFVDDNASRENVFPTVIPNWDHSPRTGKKAYILHGSTPQLFKKHLLKMKDVISNKETDKNIVFIKSWNEWGAGNYLEPDIVWGRQYLEALKEAFFD